MVKIPEEEYDEMAECPTCGAEIAIDALICPNCGQEFEEEYGEDVESGFEETSEEVFEEEHVEEPEPSFDENQDYYEEDEPADVPESEEMGDVSIFVDPTETDTGDVVFEDEEKPVKMFWLGVILILLGFYGGPIMSYLHDALRIPTGGIFGAYEVFGWVNWLVAIIGTIMTGLGVVLLLIGWMRIKRWRERMEALLEEPEPTAEAID
ncbi:MAG: zinc ribbon domain-containing protein [Candidatus Thermoplasmatota archaeon]|nr:zinc ribbon domain-containing protein [Candidatus Thermoplasmatota archaeon]